MPEEIELIPGNAGAPLFTPEAYERFLEWWQEEVVPELKVWDQKRAAAWAEFIFGRRH